MSAALTKPNAAIPLGGSVARPIRFGVAAAAIALGLGCGHLSVPGQPARSIDFEVRNATPCFLRVYAMDPGLGTLVALDELAPGERTVVNVPPGMRVHTRTHTKAGADLKPLNACHRSGQVRINRVQATT